MADISHADMTESLGNNTAGFVKGLANGAANFTCQLYVDYPWYMQGRAVFGDYAKGFWDEMCSKRPPGLPSPPPPPPFLGGQCPTVYEIYVGYNSQGSDYTNQRVGRLFGPIEGTRRVASSYRPDIFDGIQILCHGAYNDAYSQRSQDAQWVEVVYVPRRGFTYYNIERLVRVDGLPDNCGDLPTDYPHITPPLERLTTNINVQLSTGIAYSIPVTLNTTNNNKYNLEVDAPDLRLTFDFGGVTFSSNPVYNRINKSYDQSLVLGNQVTNLAQNFNAFTNNSNNLSLSWNLGSFTATSKAGSSAEGDEQKQSNLAYVTLDLTQVPVNAKTQEGEKAQDILYAGWFQFVAEGYYYPREPIHFRKSVFRAPLGATAYSYTLYKGFEANVTEYRA